MKDTHDISYTPNTWMRLQGTTSTDYTDFTDQTLETAKLEVSAY